MAILPHFVRDIMPKEILSNTQLQSVSCIRAEMTITGFRYWKEVMQRHYMEVFPESIVVA